LKIKELRIRAPQKSAENQIDRGSWVSLTLTTGPGFLPFLAFSRA